jgi:hypothetical protein
MPKAVQPSEPESIRSANRNPKSPAKPGAADSCAQALLTCDGVCDENSIRYNAYLRWESAGKPEGDGVDFWLEAERALAGV